MTTNPRAKKLPLAIAVTLFLGCLLLVLMAFRMSPTKEDTIIQTTYTLSGDFAPSPFGSKTDSEKDVNKAAYFANLVESVDVGYRYRFVPDGPTAEDVAEVEITALVESPGLWEKEVVLVPKAEYRGGADLTFQLNLSEVQRLGARIAKELGIGNPSRHITLRAKVALRVDTDAGTLEDEFFQTLDVGNVAGNLEWVGPLEASRAGFYEGLSYTQEGAFSYALQLRPSLAFGELEGTGEEFFLQDDLSPQEEKGEVEEAEEVEEVLRNLVYYRRIVESVDVSYSYSFVAEGLEAETWVEILAVLTDPDIWEKEVVLVPLAPYEAGSKIDIPIDVSALQAVAAQIGEELGTRTSLPSIRLKAIVLVRAETPNGVQESVFSQTTAFSTGGNTLNWERGLVIFQPGRWQDVEYEHRGRFDYTVQLRDNLAFGPLTMKPGEPDPTPVPTPTPTPEPLPVQILTSEVGVVEPPVILELKDSYGRDAIDRVEVEFTFPFEADPRAGKVSQTVEVTGEVEGEHWKETLELVPSTTLTEDFATEFVLDVVRLYAIIESKTKEHQEEEGAHDLAITANVSTIAETEFGPIEEERSYAMTVSLGVEQLGLPEMVNEPSEGIIQETVKKENTAASAARKGTLGITGLMGVILAFVGWGYIEARRNKIGELEAEALQAKLKYKDLVVDVVELPQGRESLLVPLGSLEELAKAAEATLKPIFHLAEQAEHTYFVIDGSVLMMYTHRLESVAIDAPLTTGESSEIEAPPQPVESDEIDVPLPPVESVDVDAPLPTGESDEIDVPLQPVESADIDAPMQPVEFNEIDVPLQPVESSENGAPLPPESLTSGPIKSEEVVAEDSAKDQSPESPPSGPAESEEVVAEASAEEQPKVLKSIRNGLNLKKLLPTVRKPKTGVDPERIEWEEAIADGPAEDQPPEPPPSGPAEGGEVVAEASAKDQPKVLESIRNGINLKKLLLTVRQPKTGADPERIEWEEDILEDSANDQPPESPPGEPIESAIARDGEASAPEPADTPAWTDIVGAASIDNRRRGRPHISTVGDELRFDLTQLKETAHFTVRVTFTNVSTVDQHNWVLVKPGTRDEVAAAAIKAGAANSWIPPGDDRIIAHSGLLDPGESEEISFTAPSVGTYQFLCTLPGHSATMFGDFEFVGVG